MPPAFISTVIMSSITFVKPFTPFALGSKHNVTFAFGYNFLKPSIAGKREFHLQFRRNL